MFSPSQQDVRRFFCQVYVKLKQDQLVDPLETLAGEWIALHPEYHAVLADESSALTIHFDDSQGNPFLHMSMHLSISEQCSIDQPQGIRQAVELLAAKRNDLHEAHHEVMECLGTMLWESQRSGRPPDGQAYIDAVQRRATYD
ncbi:MAG: DUF1841 family protein [Betaproteobacteria bacterium]|nr:DUF1841 family protein [Betaproteobacteria bacterium]